MSGGPRARAPRPPGGARALRHLCDSGAASRRFGRSRGRPLPGRGALCGMAMAEGERTECAEPPRDEPPADGALKRAEELKTEANDYFKGEPGQAGAPRLQNGPGGAGGSGGALAKPWQRGAPEPRRGVAPGGKSRGLATEVPGLGDPCSQGQSMQHPWSLGVHPPLGLST